jgi:Lhr-like helicase
MLEDPLELLAKPVREAVLERFRGLAETQRAAIPHVVNGENLLLMAPTGSGKTEAALLPVFSRYHDPVVRHVHDASFGENYFFEPSVTSGGEG